MTKNNYKKAFRTFHSASKEVALESMKSAAEELKGAGGQIEEDVDLDTVDREQYLLTEPGSGGVLQAIMV